MSLPTASDLSAALARLPAAEPVLDAVARAGVDAYLVGGAVRDLWFGGTPVDLDLVVVGDVAPLAAALGCEVRAHDRFATATVRGEGGARYDLARARTEVYVRPGALPQVAPAGIREDLARRDFTVNALALKIAGEELLAAPSAVADLEAGRLRVLHPASFRDDPTRLLRLARYAGRLGFRVEPGTERLAHEALAGGALSTVSGERVGAELVLIAGEADPVAAFAALRSLGITAALGLGGLDASEARRALTLLPGDGDPVALLFGLALAGGGEGGAGGASDPSTRDGRIAHLGLTATRRDAALAVSTRAPQLSDALTRAERPSQVDAVLTGAPVEVVAVAAARARPDAARRATRWLRADRHATLEITGADLIASGIAQGPAIAAGLRAARAAHLDGAAPARAAQLAVALRAAV